MKKINLTFLSILICFSLVGCGEKSAMQKATGASAKQVQVIDSIIEDAGISYEMINEAKNSVSEATIPENDNAYNLIDKDGNNYFLILDKNFNVMLILDANGYALYESPTILNER